MKFIAQVLVYEEGDCLERAVTPWLNVCEQIDIFEGAFQTTINLGYPSHSTDQTIAVAHQLATNKNVNLKFHNYWNEPILRNDHLFQTIQKFGRDETILFILDGDEIYSQDDVKKCIDQVTREYNKVNTHWVNMKNYINDEHTYYNGFRVPRFFKLKGALGFSGYNNVSFEEGVIETDIADVLPKHLSWCPMPKARRKLEWQSKSLNWLTSFVEQDGKLVLNDEYYIKTGKVKPTLYHE